jgi:perosamine synthetase
LNLIPNTMNLEFKEIIDFIRSIYGNGFIPLHEPKFIGNEKEFLCDCIDSTFVSSVGKYVDLFEEKVAKYTGAKKAVVTVNGTAALHIALKLCSVKQGDEVITQPLTFIATCNAISYTGAKPIFVDVNLDTMGMSPEKLNDFLSKCITIKSDGFSYNKNTGNRIKACVPMHTFGHPCKIDEVIEICNKYNIDVVEDAAESLGSTYKEKHTGLMGKVGIVSFNGNKIITTGGGGMIITNNNALGNKAKHITTTAKVPHKWEYIHDECGYNYRMPNINAALGCAQLEHLSVFLENKRNLAQQYKKIFEKYSDIIFFEEPKNTKSNYWLNSLIFKNKTARDNFLGFTNKNNVMTRPIWTLMNKLDMFNNCFKGDLTNSEWLEERVVNIPSSVNI